MKRHNSKVDDDSMQGREQQPKWMSVSVNSAINNTSVAL